MVAIDASLPKDIRILKAAEEVFRSMAMKRLRSMK